MNNKNSNKWEKGNQIEKIQLKWTRDNKFKTKIIVKVTHQGKTHNKTRTNYHNNSFNTSKLSNTKSNSNYSNKSKWVFSNNNKCLFKKSKIV